MSSNQMNIHKLADHIEGLLHAYNDKGKAGYDKTTNFFNLGWWLYDGFRVDDELHCGTAACIGGWVQIFINKKLSLPKTSTTSMEKIAEWLGIDYVECDLLCYPDFVNWDIRDDRHGAEFDMSDVSSVQAAEVLRLIAYGSSVETAYRIVLHDEIRPEGFVNSNPARKNDNDLQQLKDDMNQLLLTHKQGVSV